MDSSRKYSVPSLVDNRSQLHYMITNDMNQNTDSLFSGDRSSIVIAIIFIFNNIITDSRRIH